MEVHRKVGIQLNNSLCANHLGVGLSQNPVHMQHRPNFPRSFCPELIESMAVEPVLTALSATNIKNQQYSLEQISELFVF